MLKLAVVAAFSLLSSSVFARVVRMQIKKVEPAFQGKRFAQVGSYEKVTGRYYGELDPNDPLNAVIVNIDKAPRNARGMVEYSAEFYILRPKKLENGNNTTLIDFANRGEKLILAQYNYRFPLTNDPANATDLGDAFLMREGFSMAWSGYLSDVTKSKEEPETETIDLPVATNADGSAIEGLVWDQCCYDKWAMDPSSRKSRMKLSFPIARMNKREAKLLVRERRDDKPVEMKNWEFDGNQAIRLTDGTRFKRGLIYQFVYRTKNPKVAGIAYAAQRDFASFLKYEKQDTVGNRNPLYQENQKFLSYGASQTGWFSNEFLYLGFNEDETHRKVFDGMEIHVGSWRRPFINWEFAQPGASDLQRAGMLYPNNAGPFTWQNQLDPVTGRTDGLLNRANERGVAPVIMATMTQGEFYQRDFSMMLTGANGTMDLPIPSNVRMYYFSGTSHFPTETLQTGKIWNNQGNDADYFPFMRALLLRLNDWVHERRLPPKSVVPRVADGTLVASEDAGYPSIPGVTIPKPRVQEILDYGLTAPGRITQFPVSTGIKYSVLVPKVDKDGNDIAGIRPIEVSVPLATHAGWNTRGSGYAVGDLADLAGSRINFPYQTPAGGDTRRTIKDRYDSFANYMVQVKAAVAKLVRQGFVLEADVATIQATARQNWKWTRDCNYLLNPGLPDKRLKEVSQQP